MIDTNFEYYIKKLKKTCFLLLSLTIIVSCLSVEAQGNDHEDEIRFIIGTPERNVETDYYLIGQYSSIGLEVVFGNNVTSYGFGIAGNHPFSYFDNGTNNEYLEAGWIGDIFTIIDPNSDPGLYEFEIIFNYTKTDGEKISKTFNLSLELIKTWEILDVIIPDGYERIISVEIETFIFLESLSLRFDADGDIGFHQGNIIMNNVSAGTYTLETEIKYYNDPFSDEDQFVWYHLKGFVDNRSLEILEDPLPIDVQWTNEEKGITDDDEGNDDESSSSIFWMIIFVIICIILILVTIIVLYSVNKKRNMTNQNVQVDEDT